jgi:hypothetical protein
MEACFSVGKVVNIRNNHRIIERREKELLEMFIIYRVELGDAIERKDR